MVSLTLRSLYQQKKKASESNSTDSYPKMSQHKFNVQFMLIPNKLHLTATINNACTYPSVWVKFQHDSCFVRLLVFHTHTKPQVLDSDKTFRGNLHLKYRFDNCGPVEQITGAASMVLNYAYQHHHQPRTKRAQLHNKPVCFTFTDKTFHSMALGLTTC